MGYQRFLSPVFKPFNPLELVREIGGNSYEERVRKDREGNM